jgi:hypothetical protein
MGKACRRKRTAAGVRGNIQMMQHAKIKWVMGFIRSFDKENIPWHAGWIKERESEWL